MNQLELFKATMAHESHGEFLFYANFTPDLENRLRKELAVPDDMSLTKYFGMFERVYVGIVPMDEFKEKYSPENRLNIFGRYFEDVKMQEGSFINGLGVLEIPGSMYHFTRYLSPLRNAKTLAEMEDFPFTDPTEYTGDHMAHVVEKAHSEGLVAACTVGHIYEDSWQIRGYEDFLVDMIENPEICEFILDKITQRNMAKAVAGAKAGVDIIFTGDDVANQRDLMFAPEMWRKFIKTRWAKVYQAVKEINPKIQIWYHSDGNIERIIPELIEIGATILNPIQPECLNPIEIKKKYGKKIVLDGTIGTQTTMPFGSADEVRSVVKNRKIELGYDGALILSPTHILEPEVPIENVLAFVKECGGSI